jgi:hypothetical protein
MTVRQTNAHVDTLLAEALAQAKTAYQFAPGSYTFGAMAAVMNTIERLRAPDWIAEFISYNEEANT